MSKVNFIYFYFCKDLKTYVFGDNINLFERDLVKIIERKTNTRKVGQRHRGLPGVPPSPVAQHRDDVNL